MTITHAQALQWLDQFEAWVQTQPDRWQNSTAILFARYALVREQELMSARLADRTL